MSGSVQMCVCDLFCLLGWAVYLTCCPALLLPWGPTTPLPPRRNAGKGLRGSTWPPLASCHLVCPAHCSCCLPLPCRPAGQRPGRGQQRLRKRQRAMLPYAWGVLGQGGDFDQVGHVGRISRSEYAQSLEEELE